MRQIDITGQYKKDLKLARKRHLPEDKLNKIIFMLANDQALPAVNKDHALYGDYEGTRECHIQPDWLLIYEIHGDVLVLMLYRLGTHSELFKK